jgi:hypothetical protein
MKLEEWLASNPAVQEPLDAVRGGFSHTWSRILEENLWACHFHLRQSSSKTPTLRSHWTDLMRSVRSMIGVLAIELPRVAAEHHAALSTYPGRWLDDVVRDILEKELVCKDGRNIVDVWIEAVSEWGHGGQRTLAHIYEMEDVDADKALSALRGWVSKTIAAELLISFRTGFLSVSAGTTLEDIWQLPTTIASGSPTGVETRGLLDEGPSLTLADLNDRNRHQEVIWGLYPQLVATVDGALSAARLLANPEDILKQFPLLKELREQEFAELLAHKSDRTPSRCAAWIIRSRTGKSINTIKKYGQPGYLRRNLRAAA